MRKQNLEQRSYSNLKSAGLGEADIQPEAADLLSPEMEPVRTAARPFRLRPPPQGSSSVSQ
jgi:hypothetical protein